MVGFFIDRSAIFVFGGRKLISQAKKLIVSYFFFSLMKLLYNCGGRKYCRCAIKIFSMKCSICGRNYCRCAKKKLFNKISYNPLVCSILAVGENIVGVLNFL